MANLPQTKYMRFMKALTAFIRDSDILVTLTGHTTGTPRIFINTDNAIPPLPCVSMSIFPEPTGEHGVEDIHVINVLCDALAVDRLKSIEIATALRDYTTIPSATLQAPVFTSDGIRATIQSCTINTLGELASPEDSSVYLSAVSLLIWWTDEGDE